MASGGKAGEKRCVPVFYYALYASLVIMVLGIAIIVGMSFFMTPNCSHALNSWAGIKKIWVIN